MYKGDFGEFTQIMSKESWIKWFDIMGNHDSDGWSNSEDWFADMLRNGIITEV